MKRFMMAAACACALTAMWLTSSEAQDPKAKVSKIDQIKEGPKFAVPDLAVTEFSGAYDGTNYNVGGTVKNVGHGEYTHTRAASGAIQGRQVRLVSVPTIKIGRYKTLRTLMVPPLKAGQTWAVPTMTISPHDLAAGNGNAQFMLVIDAGDADRANDWKVISVSLVR
jgi:hypothetical protein